MRIMMISAEYPPMPGGVGDYTRKLNQALTQYGHEVAVVTGKRGQAFRDAARVYPTRIEQWDRSCIDTLRAIVNALQPDIVHIQYQTGAYGMKVAINTLPERLNRERAHGLRIVTTAHDLLPPYLFPKAGALRDWYTKRIIHAADGAVLTNAADFHRVQAEGWNAHATFIPIGANVVLDPSPQYDRELWRHKFGVQADQTLFAYFGLLTHTKGIEVIMAALAQLPDTAKLALIGGSGESNEDQSYANALRQQIATSDIEQRVVLTGHVEPSDVSGYLLASDAVVLPFVDGYSYRRGSLIAALAHGVPVITTQAEQPVSQAPLPDLRDGQDVLLIEPNNVEQLVAAMQRLTSDQELALRLSRNGRMLSQTFAWERIAEQHIALYELIRSGRQ